MIKSNLNLRFGAMILTIILFLLIFSAVLLGQQEISLNTPTSFPVDI